MRKLTWPGSKTKQIHRKLTKLAFELKGNAWKPFTYGQKAWAFHVATRFGVKLIMFGENGELEYGAVQRNMNMLLKKDLMSGNMNISNVPMLMI